MGKLLLGVIGAITLASAASADINPATGERAEAVSQTALPQRAGAVQVLWDITHEPCFGYEPTGAFSSLVALLAGFNFTTTSAGLDNVDLSPYDIIVICAGSACTSAYTLSEAAAVQAFVAGGGGVLILGDNPAAWVWNINPLAETLGASTGVSDLSPASLFFSNLSAHPIFNGIDTVFFIAGGSLATTGTMNPVAWTDSGSDITIGASEFPCVVVTGDLNMFAEPEYFNQADNRDLAVNVFNWLASCGPVSVRESTWGSVKATYR